MIKKSISSPAKASSHSAAVAGTAVPPLYGQLAESSEDGILLCDSRRTIIYANTGACRITGYSVRELTGKKLTALYPPRDRARHTRKSTDAIRQIGTWSADLFLVRKSRGVRRCDLRMILHRFPESQDQLLMVIIRPYTEDTPQLRVSPVGVPQWDQIVESLDDALYVVDGAGTVTACNEGYVRMLGRTRDEIIGSRMPYPWLATSSVERYTQALKSVRRGGKILNTVIAWRGDDLRPIVTSMTVTKLRQTERRPEAFIVALRDVSNVVYIDELRRADDRLQLLMAELQRRTATLHTLVEIQRLVLEDAPIEKVFREIINGVQKLVQHDLGGIYLVDPDGKTLRPHVLSKQNQFSKRVGKLSLPVGQGLVGKAALTGQRAIVNNAQMDPQSIYPSGTKPATEHVIVIPLMMKNFVFGVLAIARNNETLFYEDDAEVVQSFANAALVALENAGIISASGGTHRVSIPRIPVHSSGLRVISAAAGASGESGNGTSFSTR